MEGEGKPFINALGLTKSEALAAPLPSTIYQGEYKGMDVTVAVNGKHPKFNIDSVGTVPAALTTFALLQKEKPDLLINAGTAGGFKAKGGEIGDVYIAQGFANHDRRIPIPPFVEYATGKYEATASPCLLKETGWKHGVVTTSNALDHEAKDDELMAANDASVKVIHLVHEDVMTAQTHIS